jgi:sugar lactone lactonase YvrE
MFIVFIIALALFVRVKAALELPTDFDEPIYVRAGLYYAQAMREGDLGEITHYDYNIEHPVLVKLLYGGGIALLGPDVDFDDALQVSRMISVVLGVALVALVTWVEPWAGLALALHTMNTKYSSQAYLEALPALTSALCVLALARSGGRRNRWLWLSAAALGMTAASKYIYVVVGLVVVGWLVWDIQRSALRWRDLLLFGLVAALTFLAFNPILWPDPPGRLADSVAFHGAYTASAEVARYSYPWWKPLDYMSRSFPVQWHGGVFLLPLDELIFLAGLAGLVWLLWPTRVGVSLRLAWAKWRDQAAGFTIKPAALPRREGLLLTWFLAGVLFLFLWPTKWPQYTLVTATPLCLLGGLAIGEARRWLRQDRAYWGKGMSFDVLPRELWISLSVLAILAAGLGIWRSIVRHRHLRGWTVLNRETSSLPSNVVQTIALDRDGRVWIGTTRGVAILELPQKGPAQWTIYNRDNSGLPDNDVHALAAGDEGQMWIGTDSGLTRFERNTWTTFTSLNSPLPALELRDLTVAPDGSVWAATAAGIAVLMPDENSAAEGEWRVYNTANSNLLNDVVFDIAVQASSEKTRVWFATDQGVSVLDLHDNTWTSYTSQNSGLAWDGVSDIAFDAQGQAWFTTFSRGVSTLSPDGVWGSYNVRTSGLPWNIVTAVEPGCSCGERSAWLWLAVEGPGAQLGQQLAAYEPPPTGEPDETGRWHVYGYKNSGLPDSVISDIAVQCPAGTPANPTTCDGLRIWIATLTAGLAVYEIPDP